MTDSNSQRLGFMPTLVVGLAILLIVAGVVWYGITVVVVERIWRQMLERSSGPLSFRFILQPSVAAIVAIHDGIKDARAGRSPFLQTIIRKPRERIGRMREGLIATARIILIAIAMDVVYQILVFKTFYPDEAVIIAFVLGFLPYVLVRGPIARIARSWHGGASGGIR